MRPPHSIRQGPVESRAASLVELATARAPVVAAVALLVSLIGLVYVLGHFSLSTNEDELISPKLPYRQAEARLGRLFPDQSAKIVVVIDAKTPELAEEAAESLTARLASDPVLFPSVRRPESGDFVAREGLLYQNVAQVEANMQRLTTAEPFLGPLAADPSLRGLMSSLATLAQGAAAGQAQLSSAAAPMTALADALESLENGKNAVFSWQALLGGADPHSLRQFVMVTPKLNYSRLEPGAQAVDAIHGAAKSLGLDATHGVSVRMTGSVPLADDEFGSLAERALPITVLAFAAILLMLTLAVQSARIIVSILVTMFCGLIVAAALGLLIFHTFNVISIAFIPLFVGLGIDFGIQLSVRFRADHSPFVSRRDALMLAAEHMGRPLTLAALAIAAGFLAFAPTSYIGVSQLGIIAGVGMLVALALNLTLLPALIIVLRPTPRPPPGAPAQITRLDQLVLAGRRRILTASAIAAVLCACLLPFLQFDFNPIHMRNPHSESVETYYALAKDPLYAPDTLEALRPSLAAANLLATRMRSLPQVAGAVTLSNLVPSDQAPKLAAIADANNLVGLTLDPPLVSPPPTDAEDVQSLNSAAAALSAAARANGPGAPAAGRLAAALSRLAAASPALRIAADQLLMTPFKTTLAQIQASLQAQPITLASLPSNIVRNWVLPDGRARISISPKGDFNNDRVLIAFIKAVQKAAPDVTGNPLGIRAGGRVVVDAFLEAGVLSFFVITFLLFLVLRRVRDVVITMAPVVLTGLLTLGSCVVIGQPLNFANIIALPLLFGIGVAFHIYFVMSWRSGGSHLLTSSLARAVFFSALTTATGFGSLWLSSHPGTASMGMLLMISLVWTLVSALIFQPALMGEPRPQPAAKANTAVA